VSPVYADRPFRAGERLANGVGTTAAEHGSADDLDGRSIRETALIPEGRCDRRAAGVAVVEGFGKVAPLQSGGDEAGTERVTGTDRIHDRG